MSVIFVVLAVPFGVEAVALGIAAAWPINLAWLARVAGQNSSAFFWLGLRVIVAAATSFAGTHLVLSSFPRLSDWAAILLGAILATVIYLVAIVVVPGGRQHLLAAARGARMILMHRRGDSRPA